MKQETLRQATAVVIGGRAVLIEGTPGSGKTTLALLLMDRGAKLVGDDGISLATDGDQLIASAAPNTSGLIEIRNVGLVARPHVSAPVALVLHLSSDAPRFVEESQTIDIAGHAIPHLLFARMHSADAIRAEIALEKFGLPSAGRTGQ